MLSRDLRICKLESYENLKFYVASGAAFFTLLLRRRVAFLYRTATCRPLFKPWVSLLSTYRQSSDGSKFCLTFKFFVLLSLVDIYIKLWIGWVDWGDSRTRQRPSLSDKMQGTCLPLVTIEPASGPLSHNLRLIENCLYIYFLWRCGPTWDMISSFLKFLDHTQRRTTVGRTPMDEWSTRRRDLYLTTHNTHNRQTFMPSVGFEPTIAAGERP